MRFVLFGLFCLAAGCGGGGASVSAARPASVTVLWPAWSRGLNAPKPASGFSMTLDPAEGDGKQVTISGARPSNTSQETTVRYSSEEVVTPGRYYARISFEHEFSTIAVAGAQVEVQNNGNLVQANGQPLDKITYYKVIHRVELQAQNAGPLNRPIQWWVTPMDEFSTVVAVDPAAIDFELTGVNRRGDDLIPTSSPYRIRAVIDGIKSQEVVGEAVATKTVSLTSYGSAALPEAASFWITRRTPNQLREISASTGATLRTIPIGSGAGPVAFSEDREKLLVGHEYPPRVSVVSRQSGTVERVITLTGTDVGDRIFDVAPVPNRPNAFIALGEDWGFYPFVYLVVDGVVMSRFAAEREQLLFTGANRFIAWDGMSVGREILILGDSLSSGRRLDLGSDQFSGQRLAISGVLLLSSGGGICDLQTFSPQTRLSPSDLWYTEDVAVLPSGQWAFSSANGGGAGLTLVDRDARTVQKRLTFTLGGPAVFGSRVLPTANGIVLWNTEQLHLITLP